MPSTMRRVIAALAFFALSPISAGDENIWVHVPGAWVLEAQTLSDLKSKLQAHVEAKAKSDGRRLRPWSEYVFQYQGQQEQGRKQIFVNALCRDYPRKNL